MLGHERPCHHEVRAVGLNPAAARYSGMSVSKNYVLVMAVCGLFAGLAGALDVLGWQFRIATNDIQISAVGFTGIAVALLGRNGSGRSSTLSSPNAGHPAASCGALRRSAGG
mgnify:CR=1 FL=1